MALPSSIVKEVLLKHQKVDVAQVNALITKAMRGGVPLSELVVSEGFITAPEISDLIASELGVTAVDLSQVKIQKGALETITKQIALERETIPFKKDKKRLHVAMTNPMDLAAIDFISKRTGLDVVPYYVQPSSFEQGVLAYKKDIQQVLQGMIKERATKSVKGKVEKIEEAAQKLPVIQLFDSVVEYAAVEKASDIHVEPLEREVLVRYRIDGILYDKVSLPTEILPVLVARVKIMSNLKIDEHRLPQDGRIKLKVDKQDLSLRISIIPTFFGEKVVARVLEESGKGLTLTKLGLAGLNLERVESAITRPHGMILATGPTGSGKTTTLYTILTRLNTSEVNINTVEDPIEYAIPRVNQMQVNPQIELTFAAGLRALLRQDPDIMMVGEIRDEETANIAINAALTGHLVLSTIHTNDAAGSIPRLADMGVEEFLIASSVNLVIAQRLVRKICDNCIAEDQLSPEQNEALTRELARSHLSEELINQLVGDGKFYKGKGCDKCGKSGLKGRIGIFEVLEVSPTVINLIAGNATAAQIQEQALKEGMELMIIDGLKKAKEGATTISEVLRVTRE
ncbi:type II/IV secretion system protein [Candidatus Dojkabacteria bacterium]|nr:type II/IV secretion system protein [Candidatus Dojkabacteria bacterium]